MSSLSTPPPASPGAALDSSSASASGDVTLQPDAESPPSRRRSTVAAAKKTPSSATAAAAAAATTGQGAASGTRSKRGTSSTTEQEETATATADVATEATTPKVEEAEDSPEQQGGKADSGHSSSSATKARSTRSSRGRQSASASSTSRSPPATAVSDKHRQRSVSTFKELASLGLRALGDGEEEPLLPRRSRRAAMSPARRMDGSESGDEERDEEDEEEDEDEEENARPAQGEGDADEGGEGETRCVCGSQDENVGLMIQCDSCKCWQHCICMGLHTEADCPDVYFCEQCRPELHIPLLRSLGVLPAARSHKKGATKQGSANSTAAAVAGGAGGKKELKEAKEAVLLLAADNERRRNAGQEPLTGWSVHQNPALVSGLHGGAHEATSPTVAHHRRQSSEARLRGARSQSRDEEAANGTRTTPGVGGRHASPKRRSTMNSRDSGWEPIPPGLLAEDWDKKDEEDERAARKRKRGRDDHSPARSISPPDRSTSNTTAADMKRRRVSAGISAHSPAAEERSRANGGRRATSPDAAAAPAPAPVKKAAWNKKKQPALDENGVPIVHAKHPNQYTYRNKEKPSAAAAAAAAVAPAVVVPAAAGQTGSADSPSPSPSKARLAEGGRKGGLRAADAGASRTGTPAPPNPGSAFGLPDHLAHLAPLLPAVLEPLTLHPPSATKAPPRTGAQARAAAASTSDDAGAGVSVEPLAYTTLSVSEARTKIRFPPKRMTMGEMRKRVRNIGEYISRSQIEAVERSRRMRLLGITVDIDEPRVRARGEEKDAQGDSEMKDATTAAAQLGSEDAAQIASSSSSTLEVPNGSSSNGTSDAAPLAAPDAESTTTSTSNAPAAPAPAQDNEGRDEISLTMRLVEELTKELASFTQRFGAAPGLPHGISA